MTFRAAPLPHEWMIMSIIGFFVSLFQVFQLWSEKWGIAFMLFFGLMFVASMVSMTTATTDQQDLEALAIHYKRR